ncbi:MAG TPA: putative glycoside hydrolase [bacterium]|nr:putative glycoside hydrolase [bacterium]
MSRALTAGFAAAVSLAAIAAGPWILSAPGPASSEEPPRPAEEAAPPSPARPPRPDVIKAIYLTSWSAATPSRVARALELLETTELNAVVIDVKDYTGAVAFRTGSPAVAAMGAEVGRLDLGALVRRFHDAGAYVAVRIAAFQDHHLSRRRPDLAVRDAQGAVWRDNLGIGWVDPAAREVWDYLVAVGRAAAAAGVDELNFDYVRFPSDGKLDGLRYPFFDGTVGRRRTLQRFFEHLTVALRPTGAVLSADLFGLTTVAADDMGIGQILEDALLYFDYVAPMVYPSHYARGFLTFANPAAHPYAVVHYSLLRAQERRLRLRRQLSALAAGGDAGEVTLARLRPWLQAFDLGASYPPSAVREQIQAVYDAGGASGWYLWSPANVYAAAALEK